MKVLWIWEQVLFGNRCTACSGWDYIPSETADVWIGCIHQCLTEGTNGTFPVQTGKSAVAISQNIDQVTIMYTLYCCCNSFHVALLLKTV